MNILTTYTLRCLKKNKVRTFVTVIGIILSVALFTAVSEGAYSGQQYLINVKVAEVGAFHGCYEMLSDAELEALKTQNGVAQVETLTDVGWALVGDTTREYPYLRIASMSEGFPELVSVRIKEGRMPENEHELLVSDMAPTTGATFQVGQVLTLNVGRRVGVNDREELDDYNPYRREDETLADTHELVCTVVGIYDRFSSDIEKYSMPGSLALTVGAEGRNYKTLFTLDSIGKVVDFLKANPFGSQRSYNKDLRMFCGYSEDENLMTVLYGLSAILFVLIFFGSVALIYNSFSISVSERTRQFGLLKSVGATKRQILRSVLLEALLLCVIGIPLGLLVGCGGIGLTLRLLQDAFNKIVNIDGVDGVSIRLAPNLPALLIAAVIGLLTALLSAWIPARRATRLSPMSAIRQSMDVKVRAREVKVSALTGKLFGLSGTLAAKNFKRNRKQYRATVISLFLSIVLFVSAFSFSSFLRKNVAGNLSEFAADVVAAIVDKDTFPTDLDEPTMLREMLALDAVDDGAWAYFENCISSLPEEAMNREVLAQLEGPEFQSIVFTVYYVPEETYAALCAKAGVDPASGQAVAFAEGSIRIDGGVGGGSRWEHYTLLDPDALPARVTLYGRNLLDYSSYLIMQEDYDEEGNPIRYGCAMMEDVITPEGDVEQAPADELIWFTAEEVQTKTEAVIGGVIHEAPLCSQDNSIALWLPLSQRPAPLDSPLAQSMDCGLRFFLQASKHAEARDKVDEYLQALCTETGWAFHVRDQRANNETIHAALLILDVFTYGFVILISLIAAANVFNTISTNVALRKREFATLKSVGMDRRGLGRMMRYECLLYGCKALAFGLPIAVGISYLIFRVVERSFRNGGFRLPWAAIGVAAGSVFLVVGATMVYAMGKMKKENIVETLRNENI